MGFGERFRGMFSGEKSKDAIEITKRDIIAEKAVAEQNITKLEDQGQTKSFTDRMRNNPATKWIALGLAVLIAERATAQEQVTPSTSSYAESSMMKDSSVQTGSETRVHSAEKMFDVVEKPGDVVLNTDEAERTVAAHYDAHGKIHAPEIAASAIEQIKQAVQDKMAQSADVTIYVSADPSGKQVENEALSAKLAEEVKKIEEPIVQQIQEETGITPTIHIVSLGEKLPAGFENREDFYKHVEHELAKNREAVIGAMHIYNGLDGVEAQKNQPKSIKNYFDRTLVPLRQVVVETNVTLAPEQVLVEAPSTNIIDSPTPNRGEIRAIHDENKTIKDKYIAKEEDQPAIIEDKNKTREPKEPEPEPKEPEPDTTPGKNPPIPNNPPKPRWKPKTVIPVTPPRWIEPSYVPPEPTQPPVRPREVPPVIKIKLEPRPRPEPIPIKPRPKLPRRPDVIPQPWVTPEPPRPPIVEPPLPPPPPPRERRAVMQGQGNPEIQAMKRSRPGKKEFRAAKDDVDSLKNVGTELKNNTGRGNVVIEETGDAKRIGSRQADARERAEGAGHGDKSQSSKEESKDKKSARAFKKTQTGK